MLRKVAINLPPIADPENLEIHRITLHVEAYEEQAEIIFGPASEVDASNFFVRPTEFAVWLPGRKVFRYEPVGFRDAAAHLGIVEPVGGASAAAFVPALFEAIRNRKRKRGERGAGKRNQILRGEIIVSALLAIALGDGKVGKRSAVRHALDRYDKDGSFNDATILQAVKRALRGKN